MAHRQILQGRCRVCLPGTLRVSGGRGLWVRNHAEEQASAGTAHRAPIDASRDRGGRKARCTLPRRRVPSGQVGQTPAGGGPGDLVCRSALSGDRFYRDQPELECAEGGGVL